MLKLALALIITALCAQATEVPLDFGQYPLGKSPSNYTSLVFGPGKAGEWKIANEPRPSTRESFSPNAPKTEIMPVLALASATSETNRFPILLYDNEIYADFTLTTRLRLTGGTTAQTAGVIFRAADETNFYALCASATDNRVSFFKVVGGIQGPPIGGTFKIDPGAWHDIKITCKGMEIRCEVDGKTFPPLNDTSLASGKLGFITQGDTAAQFADAKIDYVPIIPFAKKLLDQTIKKYPRLISLEIYARKEGGPVQLVASSKSVQMGSPGGKTETEAIDKSAFYFLRKDKSVEVTVPMRDRNGEIAAALKVEMITFIGETQNNAIGRAGLIRKYMEQELGAVSNLAE